MRKLFRKLRDKADLALLNLKAAVENKANEVKDAAKKQANDAVDNAADAAKKGLGL